MVPHEPSRKPGHARRSFRLKLPPLETNRGQESCASYSIQIDRPLRTTLITSDTDEDLDAILLRAIEPPDHSRLTIQDTLRELKLNARRKAAFKQLLKRVEMDVWTLHFRPDYESAYCQYLYEHAIPRIRYAVSIAFVFVLVKAVYEFIRATPSSKTALFADEWSIVLQLHVFFALPVLAIVLCCTWVRRLDSLCELYASVPFLVLTFILTAQKIALGSRGPIFSLFLVLVPVFGITRFRFTTSVALVTLMFGGHVIALLSFQHAETSTDVMFQGFNYLGGIIVGAVCHYRAEVLRRRNYAMLLPFCDQPLDVHRMTQKLRDPRAKKHVLIRRRTLKFKNELVEDAFYRHWYLIDPCPFDHPNAGELHRTVYRSIRFAVGAVICSQLMLVMQDWEYLYSDKSFPSAAYIIATCLRFTIVIPGYSLVPLAMFFYGTQFYWQWREQAASEDRGGVRSPTSRSQRAHFPLTPESSSTTEAAPSYATLATPVAQQADTMVNDDQHRTEPALTQPFKNNYVRVLQYLSAVIVFCHSLAMGTILLLVDRWASERNASVAPCYFLGFLNALLFPHRSGFRVRFVYATAGTVCVCVIVIATALILESDKVATYSAYMILTNILGMMVSHEEESLRRIFFVRMMLRSDEFRRRHDAILDLESWFKQRIRRWRKSRAGDAGDVTPTRQKPLKIPTVNQMVQSGKYGLVLDVGRAAIAVVAEIV